MLIIAPILKKHFQTAKKVDEVRAWTVYKGATAPNCAGAIHSDMERCFIKAEVVSYADFVEHTPNDGKKVDDPSQSARAFYVSSPEPKD